MTAALLLLQAAPPPADSYLIDFLRTLLALAGVCALAWFGLRVLARRGFGGAGKGAAAAAVRVLARVPLESRKSLYVIRAGDRVLLIGTGEAGPPTLLAELDPSSVIEGREASGSGSSSGPGSDSGSGSGSGSGSVEPPDTGASGS